MPPLVPHPRPPHKQGKAVLPRAAVMVYAVNKSLWSLVSWGRGRTAPLWAVMACPPRGLSAAWHPDYRPPPPSPPPSFPLPCRPHPENRWYFGVVLKVFKTGKVSVEYNCTWRGPWEPLKLPS